MSDVILELLDDPVASAITLPDDDIVEIQVQSDATATDVAIEEFIEISEQGPTGPPGLPGSAGSYFMHTQTTPAATWTITHNRAANPPVTLFLSSAPTEPVFTDVTYPDTATIVIEWPSPESGKAYFP